MILIGKDQLGWIQWTLANQITTTPTPKTRRPKRTRPSKKVTSTTVISTVATTITTVPSTKSAKKARRKTKPMTPSTSITSPTTTSPKTAMSIIKQHEPIDQIIVSANITDANITNFDNQDKGCSRYVDVDHSPIFVDYAYDIASLT